MILFLYGKDTFRSRRQLKEIIAKFRKDRDPQGLNVVRLDAAKKTPGEILEQLLASPFLAERRMVVIEGLLESKHKEFMGEILERIEDGKLPESNVVVFWEGNDKFKTKNAKALLDRLGQEKFAQHYELLEGSTLSTWVGSEVAERGGAIDRQSVQYLVQHVGNDMWRLHSLIDQLVSYKTSIALADVQLFLDEKADDNIFNLVDAIIGGKTKQVYKMIQQQYAIGEDAQYIFAMLLRQFRILLELRDLHERGELGPSDAVAKELGHHPFVVKKSLPLVKKYSMSQLKLAYNGLLEMDVKTKTGQADQQLLIDMFVATVAPVST